MAAWLDIIVPVCNEAESIEDFYQRVDRLGHADRLLFVDNASTFIQTPPPPAAERPDAGQREEPRL